jgi:hypothetical protein
LKALKEPLQGVLGPEFKDEVHLRREAKRTVDRETGKVIWLGGIAGLAVCCMGMVAAKPLIGGSSIVGRKHAAWQHVKAHHKKGSVGEFQKAYGIETFGLEQFRKMKETTAESTTPVSATNQAAAFRFNRLEPHSVEQHVQWHEHQPHEDDPFYGEGFSDDEADRQRDDGE